MKAVWAEVPISQPLGINSQQKPIYDSYKLSGQN